MPVSAEDMNRRDVFMAHALQGLLASGKYDPMDPRDLNRLEFDAYSAAGKMESRANKLDRELGRRHRERMERRFAKEEEEENDFYGLHG